MLDFPNNRELDVICLGRAGVDLYAEQVDTDFSEVQSFRKYVGGSAANIAVALSRLGAKTGFVSALSEDMLGRYVYDYLVSQRIDTLGIQTAPEGSRTSLAITEMKAEECGVVIYRNEAADLQLEAAKIDGSYIDSAKVLLVTGTALAKKPSREATFYAMQLAAEAGSQIVVDLDYRAYSWKSKNSASAVMGEAAGMANMLVGNREEFAVLTQGIEAKPGSAEATGQRFLSDKTRIVVVKDGQNGSTTVTHKNVIQQAVFPVTVRKPFGAGDAFLAALLAELLGSGDLAAGLKLGAAAAAINVASENCSEAMASHRQISSFMAKYDDHYQLKNTA